MLIRKKTRKDRSSCDGLATDACMKSKGQEGGYINNLAICVNEEANGWDAILNETYKKLLVALSSDQNLLTGIKEAERLWIKSVDAFCPLLKEEVKTSSDKSLMINDCRKNQIENQIFNLTTLLDQH